MKKKGLIISTVVMVVVLIASLTTATYAWFTVSNKTTIEGFNVQVVAGNAVNIGVKTDNKHKTTGIVDSDFMSGTVKWTNRQPGTIGETAGSWSDGTIGLSSQLQHQIKWGAQTKAVGAIVGTENTLSKDSRQYGFIGTGTFNKKQHTGLATSLADNNKVFLNAANLDKGTTLLQPTAAYANVGQGTTGDNTEVNGDYAYLFLGASPTKALQKNTLIIMLDATNSTGTNVGILGAVHVAYRITKQNGETTAWVEEEFFPNAAFNSKLEDQTITWETGEAEAYGVAFASGTQTVTAPTTKAGIIRIRDLSMGQNDIDQIEIIVYLAGSDADCVDSGKNASGDIKIFFLTEDKAQA